MMTYKIIPKKVCFIRSKSSAALDYRVDKEATVLRDAGYDVTILLWDRKCEHPPHERIDGVNIKRVHHKAPYNKPSLLFHMLIWWIHEIYYLLTNDIDVMHACDLDTLPPALLAKFLKKRKLVYDIFDFYAFMIARNVPSLTRNFLAKLERALLRYPDVVIIPDEERKEQLGNAEFSKLVVIVNSPKEEYKGAMNRKKNKELTLFYAGNLIKTRGLEGLVEAIHGLNGVKMIVAGEGPDEDELVPLFKNTKNVDYIGVISHNEVIKYTFSADVLFALYDPKIPNNRYASPNKLFEAMMCAKPIIVNSGTSMAKIVEKEKCGLIVPYGNIKKLKEAIVQLKEDDELRRTLGENGRRAYAKKYKWSIMKKRLMEVYKKLDNSM